MWDLNWLGVIIFVCFLSQLFNFLLKFQKHKVFLLKQLFLILNNFVLVLFFGNQSFNFLLLNINLGIKCFFFFQKLPLFIVFFFFQLLF